MNTQSSLLFFFPILAHRGCLSIETFRDGMDFYFPDKGKANRFISFLESVVPTKIKTSKKLIGTDDKSNISNFKYTNFIEVCPLCKDDLLYLPARTARNLGNITRLVMVKAISNVIHLIDPLSGQMAQLSGDAFWRDPVRPVITAARTRMTRYVVLGKEPIMLRKNVSRRSATSKQRSRLASLTLAREDDLGVNDTQFEERSNVGYLMKSGDVCVGFDLTETQFVEDEAENMRSSGKLPDIVVIRKLYGGVATKEADAAKKRKWKLARLEVKKEENTKSARAAKNDADADDMDEEDFMREVEADKEMRRQMNLYKNKILKEKENESNDDDAMMEEDGNKNGAKDGDDDTVDDQEIALEELLDGLVMDDGPDPEDAIEEEIVGGQIYEEGAKAAQDGITYVSREQSRLVKDKDGAVPKSTFGEEYKS